MMSIFELSSNAEIPKMLNSTAPKRHRLLAATGGKAKGAGIARFMLGRARCRTFEPMIR